MDVNWLIIFITILFSAFFSGVEIAFVSSNKLLVELDRHKRKLSGRILSSFVKSPSSFISSLLLGNNIALVIYGIAAARIIEPTLKNQFPELASYNTFLLTSQTIIATLIILVTAEFLPKVIFRIYSNRVLSIFAIPLKILYVIFYPLNMFFFQTAKFILRKIFKMEFNEESFPLAPIDLDMYVKEYTHEKREEETMLNPEIQMLHNAIEFKNIRLKECMIPRTEIIALEENNDIETLQQAYVESGHSKIIIYRESIDNIIGYTHAYDMFSKPKTIKAILKPILFVPGTMMANQLLSRLIKEQKSIAVVVDEFGGTSGMLTLEDVIEEIFGEINDEFDMDELIEKQTGENEYVFSGRLEIDLLNEKYHLDLPDTEEYETLAGYILHQYENIPVTGSEIEINNYRFTILKASETRIDQVRVELIES
ncbi:MAG: hemolysin family protein [Bacteroidales bacterium]|nr:hemolysin family protein [Bacteroidales bacterium]